MDWIKTSLRFPSDCLTVEVMDRLGNRRPMFRRDFAWWNDGRETLDVYFTPIAWRPLDECSESPAVTFHPQTPIDSAKAQRRDSISD